VVDPQFVCVPSRVVGPPCRQRSCVAGFSYKGERDAKGGHHRHSGRCLRLFASADRHYGTPCKGEPRQVTAKGVFLPLDSISPSAGRWVTPNPGKRASESDFDSGVGLVGNVPNDFSPSLSVSHSFVLLRDFQHRGLRVRVAHQFCSRALVLPVSSSVRPEGCRHFAACGGTFEGPFNVQRR
jgi:hypothetical protein